MLTSSKSINRYNWTFWGDKALVRVEPKNLYSKIVQYNFNIDKLTLTNPKTILQDKTFSYEDPRLISYDDFTYVKYNVKKQECYFMKNNQQMTKGHAWEKNWQFITDKKYIYKIKPLVIKDNTSRVKFRYTMPHWLEGFFKDKQDANEVQVNTNAKAFGKTYLYRLSSNVFSINNRNFIFFHTAAGDLGHYDYYQGVIELDHDFLPLTYSIEPFFNPPPLDNPYKFKKNENKCVYVTSVRIINDKTYICAGINDCECALFTLDNNTFIDWYDKYKDFVKEEQTSKNSYITTIKTEYETEYITETLDSVTSVDTSTEQKITNVQQNTQIKENTVTNIDNIQQVNNLEENNVTNIQQISKLEEPTKIKESNISNIDYIRPENLVRYTQIKKPKY